MNFIVKGFIKESMVDSDDYTCGTCKHGKLRDSCPRCEDEFEIRKLRRVLNAALILVSSPSWAGISDKDCNLEKVLIDEGYLNKKTHRNKGYPCNECKAIGAAYKIGKEANETRNIQI